MILFPGCSRPPRAALCAAYSPSVWRGRMALLLCLLWGLAGCQRAPATDPDAVPGQSTKQLGTVTLPQICTRAANQQLARGSALLHHMTYEGARRAFARAAVGDPACALADWGQAMTYIHPLWSDPPSAAQFDKARALLATARTKAANRANILAYVTAAEGYFRAGKRATENANLVGFANGWRQAYQAFPQDLEIASLYALALLGTADPADKTYTRQREAGAIAEQILRRQPDHPGAHHYLVHAYDYPPLASEALAVANSYGGIAPDIPHALHMPTHIFTRLGLWSDSIDMNLRSAKAALARPAGNQLSLHYLHAQDYLIYAYLQQADDDKARQAAQALHALTGPFQPHVASAYTFAAVPARMALERQQWQQAANIPPRSPANFPWDNYPAMEAISHFARGLGAAHIGDSASAGQAIAQLTRLANQTKQHSGYWGKQVDIMRLSVQAWRDYQAGQEQQALATMQQAAELEASTEKHPVTPGEVLPARELLADMLLRIGRYQLAQQAYEKALQRNPNRYNSLYGAGHAAELADDPAAARRHYRQLLTIAGQSGRPGLARARYFITNNPPQG